MDMPVSQELAKIFEAIDTNFNGYITRDELERYVKKTGQPEEMVDDWFRWFDFENSGKITFEDLCTTLAIGMSKNYSEKIKRKRELEQKGTIANGKLNGVDKDREERERREREERERREREARIMQDMDAKNNADKQNSQRHISNSAMDGVKILYNGHTKPGLIDDVVQEVKGANMDRFDRESQFARYLKETMEKKWGQHWQVVVSKATFGCSVGHEEDYFIHFRYGPYLYILYRTPE